VKVAQKKIPVVSGKKVNLYLDEKQDRVLKPHQLSCRGGNSGGRVEGMMGEERS